MAKSRETNDWKITRAPRRSLRRGGGAGKTATVPDEFLQASGVSVADAFDATPPRRLARAAEPGRRSW